MKGVLVALAIAMAAPCAQETVRIVHDLSPDIVQRATELLQAELPTIAVDWQSLPPAVIESRLRAADLDADLLFGVDGVACGRLARAGVLRLPRPADVAPFDAPFRGPGDVFVVPLVSPLVFAYDLQRRQGVPPPADWEQLLESTADDADRLLVGTPDTQPELWAALFRWQLRNGASLDQALGWLRALDARRPEYCVSRAELRDRWRAGTYGLALLELVDVGVSAGVGHVVPAAGTAACGLGLALLRDVAPARSVHSFLTSVAFVRAMCSVSLVPTPRADLEVDTLPAATRAIGARLWPYDLTSDPAPWFARWSSEVDGQGERLEQIESWLDTVLFVVFAGFLVLVYRHLQRVEPQQKSS